MSNDIIEHLNQYLRDCPFTAFTRMTATDWNADEQTLTMSMPFREEMERIKDAGQYHGGPIASLIDTAGCFALIAVEPKPYHTINYRTDYLSAAANSDLIATAHVRKMGRSVCVVDINVADENDKLVAVGRGTFGS